LGVVFVVCVVYVCVYMCVHLSVLIVVGVCVVYITNELITKQRSTVIENKLLAIKGESGRGIN